MIGGRSNGKGAFSGWVITLSIISMAQASIGVGADVLDASLAPRRYRGHFIARSGDGDDLAEQHQCGGAQ